MKLNKEEQDMLDGKQGSTLQKVMRTLVLYGRALGAERFVDIEGDGHFSVPYAFPGVGLRPEMLDELTHAGLKTKHPFTLDPRAPLDFENLGITREQEQAFEHMLRNQARYDEQMLQLGLKDAEAYTCTPYLDEVGNIPRRGTRLAWSESSCVVFANSVLAARTNRNAAVMDILCNIAGKTPLIGFLTDEGRRANWWVEVKTRSLPNPQLLGAAIGMKVMEDVPYIVGLDLLLGSGLNERTLDYLKEMGAACAAIGAVGLYHVENITPEAVDLRTDLLSKEHKTYIIDDRELQNLMASYPVMWANRGAKPQKCLVGCPHLSLRELHGWTRRIHDALERMGRDRVAVQTILFASPQVLRRFAAERDSFEELKNAGVRLSSTCAELYMNNPLCAREAVITNSNKLRTFTPARMLLDEDLVEVLVSGDLKG
jgi:hypothetical protein